MLYLAPPLGLFGQPSNRVWPCKPKLLKANLKAASDKEIERLRSALQIAAAEHQVRCVNLQGKRAEVIAELYTRAVDAYQDGQQFVLVDGYIRDPVKNQEASDKTHKKLLEFYFFVEKHRIYLPTRTCQLLEAFVNTVRTHVINVSVYGSIEYPNQQTQSERREVFRQAYAAFEKEIPAIRTELQCEFRKMLGSD